MNRRWLLFFLFFLGLSPASWLTAQTSLGGFQLQRTPPDSSDTEINFGWNRPLGVAPTTSTTTGDWQDVSLFQWVPNPWAIRHADPNDPARHVGLGHPLVGTSWRNRPFHVGWLFGELIGDQLIDERVDQDVSTYGGYRLGWDFDHYWGTEIRFGFSYLDLSDTTPLEDAAVRTSRDQFWDLNLMYYPWGDARWRPFVSVGVGAGNFYFKDETAELVRAKVVTFPLSAGFKYYRHNWLAWRVSVTDQWSLGAQGVDSMHNIALTAGVEVHFGGSRVGYFPYRSGLHLW